MSSPTKRPQCEDNDEGEDRSDNKGDDNNDDIALTDAVKRRDWSKVGEILQSGVGHTQILQRGAGHTQILQSGAGHTQILQRGAGHTHILQHGAGHTQILQSGASHTQILQSGAGHTQILQSGTGHTHILQSGVGHTQILQSGAGHTQRMWAITQACRLAGEEAVLQHIIPHLHTEGELEAVREGIERGSMVRQGTFPWIRNCLVRSRALGKLLQRALDLSMSLLVVQALNHSGHLPWADYVIEEYIVPVCLPDQLLCLFTLSVRERQWQTVSSFLRHGMGDEQLRWAVEEALQHDTPENENGTSSVIAFCSDDQLGVVFEEAVRRHLWRTVRKLLDRPVDDDLVRKAIEESYRNVCGEPLTDYTLPAYRDDQRRDFELTQAVRRGKWKDVGTLLERGVHATLGRWAIEESYTSVLGEQLTDYTLPACRADQRRDFELTYAVRRGWWKDVGRLLDRPVDGNLVRQAIGECYRNVCGEPLTDYTLPACRDDQRRDFELTDAVRRGQWKDVGTLLERGVHDTLCRWAVTEGSDRADDDDRLRYILPHCDDDHLESLLTQAVTRKQWRAVGFLLQRGRQNAIGPMSDAIGPHTVVHNCGVLLISDFGPVAFADCAQRRAVIEACKQADKGDIIQHILPHIDNDPLDVTDSPQNARWADNPQHTGEARSADNPQNTSDGSWRERHKRPGLNVDQLHLMLDEVVRRGLWEVSSQCPQTERHAGRDCPHAAVHLHGNGVEHFFLRVVKHRSNVLLFCVLAFSSERNLTRVITAIRDRIDRRQTLSDIVCGSVAAMTPFPVDDTGFSKLRNFKEDCHLHTLAIVYLDVLHFVVCPELDRARTHSTKNLQAVVSGWQQQLAELYVNTKYSTDTELALVYVFFCLCRSLDLTEESSDLLCVVLSTIPLLPSLQSSAVRLMLRAKRWDVINNAVLWRVWEDVRRSVLRAAVEQREWTTVRHMADHSLYDDERNWALMQAYYEDRWDVVLALADFGHNADQRKRIYRQVAKHGDGETVLELFKRGADVRTVREQLETASPSRERPLRQETVARYQDRLSWLAWLEWKMDDTADNLQGAIQRNNWRAVLHRVRCEPSTLSLALDAAIEKEAWHVVVQLARLGMDAAQRDSLFPEVIRRRQWAVGRALLEGGYFDGGQHGVSVELRRAVLPQLLNVGQWILVARVMEHGVDDEERRQVMWEALYRREGSVVAHIISIMEGRLCVEERERVFQQAIRQGVWQALKRLVEEKDSAGIAHRDLTLPAAAKHHQWDILTHCLQHGADVDKRDAAGDTMLHRAARERDWEGVQGLLLHGVANQHLLDSQGYSVLHMACGLHECRSEKVDWTAVKMLVEFQCDVNQPDPYGVTPLQRMIQHNQGEIIKSAMFWGRNVCQTVTSEGETALHALCEAGVLDNMHIAVARGGDPLAVMQYGDTVLSLTVKNEKCPQELLAECIQLGISTNQPRITDHRMERAGEGIAWYTAIFPDAACSPLYHAIRHCNKEITEMLYESGSCSNRELYNIAHKWAESFSIPPDQVAYVCAIVNTPRRLESMCRLVISHHIGVCKPRRRRERVMALRLPTWFSHLHDYILFTDLTGPGSGIVRPRRSSRTNNPASRYTFHLATIQDKMAVYFSLSVHNYCGRWQLSHSQQL